MTLEYILQRRQQFEHIHLYKAVHDICKVKMLAIFGMFMYLV
jgi:hypothetical protein